MFRRLRYSVAASLDGCIAGPHGEFDWIPMDPEIDFKALYEEFDTIVMGRTSYDVAKTAGGAGQFGMPVFVYSRTLPEGPLDGVTVVGDAVEHVRELRDGVGKDIWLWGGGRLFQSLAAAGLVDGLMVAIVPFVLGGGLSLAPPPSPRMGLRLRSHRVFETTGTVLLDYDVERR